MKKIDHRKTTVVSYLPFWSRRTLFWFPHFSILFPGHSTSQSLNTCLFSVSLWFLKQKQWVIYKYEKKKWNQHLINFMRPTRKFDIFSYMTLCTYLLYNYLSQVFNEIHIWAISGPFKCVGRSSNVLIPFRWRFLLKKI